MAGNKNVYYDCAIYLSKKDNADIQVAQAYLMRSKNAFPDNSNIHRSLEYFFETLSLLADTDTMSVIAATLANGGVCPFTGNRILKSETVESCLSVMSSCGLRE